jgi:hypothetical protein
MYFIRYENKDTSPSVSDLDGYIVIRKLLDSIFPVLLALICQQEIQTSLQKIFFHKVTYTRYDMPLFIQ